MDLFKIFFGISKNNLFFFFSSDKIYYAFSVRLRNVEIRVQTVERPFVFVLSDFCQCKDAQIIFCPRVSKFSRIHFTVERFWAMNSLEDTTGQYIADCHGREWISNKKTSHCYPNLQHSCILKSGTWPCLFVCCETQILKDLSMNLQN